MASVDIGQQKIGWKYSTPLQSDYLNTFNAGLHNQGLVSRPKIEWSKTNKGANVTIHQFSAIVIPLDRLNPNVVDADGNTLVQRIVKVSTTSDVNLTITTETVAIGFEYWYTSNGVVQSQWYGDFRVLSGHDLDEGFDGIIIATVQNEKDNLGSTNYSISTNGADISDDLLKKEGWNPTCWLSLVHPKRRPLDKGYSRLEVRCHNELYSGYINGNSGCLKLENLYWDFENELVPDPQNPEQYIEVPSTKGKMPGCMNLFNIQSAGFNLCDYAETLPIEKTHGGVFALVDATEQNKVDKQASNCFSNLVKIYPVMKEDVNIYYDDGTLVIN